MGSLSKMNKMLKFKMKFFIKRGSNPILGMIERRFTKFKKLLKRNENSTLFAAIDLNQSAINFPIVRFLTLAYLESVRRNLNLHIVIIPGRLGGLGGGRQVNKRYDVENHSADLGLEARFFNILIESLRLLPQTPSFSVLRERQEFYPLFFSQNGEWWPINFTPSFPVSPKSYYRDLSLYNSKYGDVKILKAPTDKAVIIDSWLKLKKINTEFIVISLRNSVSERERNSNLTSWIEFARNRKHQEIDVVFIPDSEDIDNLHRDKIGEFCSCSIAATNIGLRLALMEKAKLVMMKANGTQELAMLSRNVKYCIFLNIDNTKIAMSEQFLKFDNIEVGKNFPFAGHDQTVIWEDDTIDNLEGFWKRYSGH